MKADNEEEEKKEKMKAVETWDLRLEKGPSLPTTNSP